MAGVAVLKDEYRVERSDGEPAFTVDLDGFEGPLDLLLELARRQKVDLARISVLALAEQYLAFVEAAHTMRLELAADYLVMAAWLAYLKSRLLLPAPAKAEDGDPAELADALAQRLRRLEQIRKAAEALLNRPRLGRDVFARGAPEAIAHSTAVVYEATLYDLLSAYARQRQKHARACAPRGARRLVARRGARGADASVGPGERLDGPRIVADRLWRRAVNAPHRARLLPFGFARNGSRRPDRIAAGPGLRAAVGARRPPRGVARRDSLS